MRFECNFGTLKSGPQASRSDRQQRFRIALLGDFSGRALAGKLDTGAALASRKPLRVDVDNLDDVIQRLGISIELPWEDDQAVELEIESIDDFHPDELYDKLELFEELASLRRRLGNQRSFAVAAEEVRSWSAELAVPRRRRRQPRSRATTVPVSGRLSDFARLSGRSVDRAAATADVEELVKQLVAPYVMAEADPQQEQLIGAVDESLSAAMRRVLQQSEFQSLESIWRGVDLLVRNLETSTSLQIVLYDISAEEVAADLSGSDSLEETGLYKLLVEQPLMDAAQGPLAALLGYYQFEQTPPHAELLGRMAKIAAAAEAPFIASISKACLDRQKNHQPHPLVVEAWTTLRQMPEAKYLGLTVPQFLLRLPYGKKSDPISSFRFEEFTPQTGVSGMLWGNGVLLVGLMLGQTYARQGLKQMQIGSIMSFDEMPFYYVTDAAGDQVALPCTDRLLSQRMAEAVIASGYIPVLSIQGQPVVRLGSTASVSGEELAGIWPPSADAAQMQQQAQEAAEQRLAQRRQASAATAAGDRPDDLAEMTKAGTLDDDADDDDFSGFSSGDDDDLSASTSDDDDDSDLSSLLDDSDDDEQDSGGSADDDEEMDPELAALLADL